MLAILIRHNATEQRKTLTDRDVIIDPALGDFSSLDFTEHAKAMKIGEEAARGVSRAAGGAGRAGPTNSSASPPRAARARSDPPTFSFLRVEPGSERYAGAIDALFGDQVGKTVDATELGKRVNELYGQGNLEIFDYRVVPGDAAAGAAARLRPGIDHAAQFLGP